MTPQEAVAKLGELYPDKEISAHYNLVVYSSGIKKEECEISVNEKGWASQQAPTFEEAIERLQRSVELMDIEENNCPHDEHDHGICLECDKDITDDLVAKAEYIRDARQADMSADDTNGVGIDWYGFWGRVGSGREKTLAEKEGA
uniref:hypothetical protein n=1 Tax=Candidatus Wunengus sp. YC61 TaxID=3367698 RepID=UPI004029A86A